MTPTPLPYERFAQELAAAQNATQRAHAALAATWQGGAGNLLSVAEELERLGPLIAESLARLAASQRLAAAGLEAVAASHAALAENIPDAAQAAADLGIMSKEHDADNLRQVLQVEQQLNQQRDDDVVQLRREVQKLAAAVAELTTEVRDGHTRAERHRRRVLEALGATDGEGA